MKPVTDHPTMIRRFRTYPCSFSRLLKKRTDNDLRRWLFKAITLLLMTVFSSGLLAQDNERNWRLNGHLQVLQDLWIPPESSQWQTMTMIGNRLDFRWNPGNLISFHAGVRNNLNLGQMVTLYYPYYAQISTREDGLLDMTKLWKSDSSYYFYSNIDRLNMKLRKGKFEVTLGRQRINWAINSVWTPNDIFNSFNYFDFDYVERPGCDAVLMEYFTDETSSLQFGFKMDHDRDVTSALMYKFTKWNYDFQAFTGVMTSDLVAGAGWSGDLKGAGITGELSYFHPYDHFADTNGIFEASVSTNYTFKNSLFINASYLYNSAGTKGPAGYGTVLALYADISAKNFTRAKHSIYAGVGYPLTPLIRADLSSIFNPNDHSGFVGPSIDISLSNNVGFLLIGQIFWGAPMTEFGDYGTLCYFRLKWNF